MEHCSKCGKALPKIGGMYIFTCYGSGKNVLCEKCHQMEIEELRIEGMRRREIMEATPNNGCCNCGAEEAKMFDDENRTWWCDKCFYTVKYGEARWNEIVEARERLANEKQYGHIKLFMKERQFVRLPLTERYNFSDVISYEFIDNGNVEKSGSLGSAVVGGVIAGPVGAVIGYASGAKTRNICREYKIVIRMRGQAPIVIGYIGGGSTVRYDSMSFAEYRNDAKITIQGIEIILNEAQKECEKQLRDTNNQGASIADEILKLKSLHDSGIITGEEFLRAKEKLL